MRTIDWALIRSETSMVVLTAKYADDGSEIMAADFRDSFMLVHKPTRIPLGMDSVGKVRLGNRSTLKMVNGVWRVDADSQLREQYLNVLLSADSVSLEPIQ